jgi:NTE family protein
MKFGLALSGGGLRGTAFIGVLRALEENGLRPSWISGTSAGSIFAALYVCGYSWKEMEETALAIHKGIFDPDIPGIMIGIIKLAFGKDPAISGILKGKKIEKLMEKLTQGKNIRDISIPIAITAVNINNGQTIYFVNRKDGLVDDAHHRYIDNVLLSEAVRASIAIPVIFQTKMVDGIRLVDGGVTDSLPASVLKRMGAPRVIGINLGYSGQMKKEVDSILEIGNQSLNIMEYQITRLRNGDADLIINPRIYDVGLTELEKIPECIQRGYWVTKENIHHIRKAIGYPA